MHQHADGGAGGGENVQSLTQAWTHRRRVSTLVGSVHALMRGLAKEVHARGARPEAEDASVGGHLMRVRSACHPQT